MSKTSTPSIFPRISRRSRPVACSKSVGTVPGAAPGPIRSSSVLISIDCLLKNAFSGDFLIYGRSTAKGLDFLLNLFLDVPADRGSGQGALRSKRNGGTRGSCSSESEGESTLQKHCRAIGCGGKVSSGDFSGLIDGL
jgi:hypothetical protein